MNIDKTVSAMLRTSKTNGNYVLHAPGQDIQFPNVEKQALYYGENKEAFTSHVGIVNVDDGRVITVASKGYEILSHADVIELADAAVEKAGFKDAQRSTYMINGGDRMLVDYVLSDQTYEIRKGDEVHPKLTFKNSYDLGWAASVVGGLFRLVCSNGAYIGEAKGTKRKHTASLTPENVDSMLAGIVLEIPKIQQRLGEWAKTPIKATQELNIGALGLSQTEKDGLLVLRERSTGLHVECKQKEIAAIDGGKDGQWVDMWVPAGDTTMYDVWNLITEFTTHRVHNPIRRDIISTAANTLFHSRKVTIN